jgi:enterobactin synthetase component F
VGDHRGAPRGGRLGVSARRRLTSAQRGIWFAQALDPESPAFVTADCVEASPGVAPAALAAAVAAAVREVPGLHARFGSGADGEPFQELRAPDVEVSVLDVADPEGWMAADRARPFDLASGPLSRQAVLRLADGRVWWYQAIHHLATDAYGTSLVLRRAARHLAGDAPPASFGSLDALDDLDAAYAASDQRARDRAFWLDALAGLTTAPSPATAPSRAIEGRFMAAERPEFVPRGAGEGTGWRAPHRHEVVLATVPAAPRALALLAVWLHRMTGAEDVVLGLPWMGRLGSPAARVPACWVNVLPLRLQVTPRRTLGELTAVAAACLKAAGRHGRYRYEDLRRDLGRLGDERRLVGPLVNLKPFTREVELGGRPAAVRNLAAGPVDDLTITLSGDRLILDADPSRYSAGDTRAHAERLALTLATDAGDDVPCGRLAVATPADTAAELRAARGPRHAVPDGTLWSGLAAQAARTPHAVAVVADDATLTYAELHRRAEALARRLAARGAGPGEVVGVALDRCSELMVTLLAVLRTGAAYLPLEPDAPADRTAAMRADARPVCVVDAVGIADGDADPGAGPRPADLAYVLYTSGSTGRPKGVAIGHRAIVNRLAWMQDAFAIGPGARVLLKTPLGFDVSVWELFWPLLTGATLVVAAPGAHRDPQALAQIITTNNVDTMHFVPSMLAAFVAEPAAAACTSLRRVITSGEALGGELARKLYAMLPGARLHNLYGPTEAAVDVTHWPCDPRGEAAIPIGHPVWNTDAYVLDAALQPCPPGVIGELYLGGVQLADGYRGRPALTAERFVADPHGAPGARMYRTGDLARRRPDGALEYHGRTDQQVKVRGVRIEPGEVEAALLRHPSVAQAAVIAREDRPGDVRLAAYVVVDERAPAEPAALRHHAAALLPDAMVPSVVVVLDALPVGPSGKLDRRALPVPDAAAPGGGRAPADPREQLLCELFAEALGVARVGPDDGLFDLGGHSLLAARLAGRIREALGVELTIGALFAAPTPAALAARLRDGGGGDALEPLLALRGGAPGARAIFCVHPAGGLGWCYAPLAARLPAGRPVWALQADGSRPPTLDALAAEYVARVRASQPEGPYALVGWSVGGVIAHAMAVLLQEAGEQVDVLVLLDAYPGDQWRHLAPPTEHEALRALLLMGGVDPDAAPESLDATLALLAAHGSALASLPRDALASVAGAVVHTAGLMRRAEHRVFRGGMTIVVAAAPRAEDWLTPAAWEPYVDGQIKVMELDCTHPELVRPEAAARIASALAATEVPA